MNRLNDSYRRYMPEICGYTPDMVDTVGYRTQCSIASDRFHRETSWFHILWLIISMLSSCEGVKVACHTLNTKRRLLCFVSNPVLIVELKDGIYRPFKKIFDVIDHDHTIYVEGTDSIIKLKLDHNKVKDLKVFNSQPAINDIIVSDEVRKSIRKNKLDMGLDFMPVYCGGE